MITCNSCDKLTLLPNSVYVSTHSSAYHRYARIADTATVLHLIDLELTVRRKFEEEMFSRILDTPTSTYAPRALQLLNIYALKFVHLPSPSPHLHNILYHERVSWLNLVGGVG